MKGLLLLFFSFFLSPNIWTQNLVPNPSFESINYVPKNWMGTDKAFEACMKDWTSPNQGSPDVFVTSMLGKFRLKRPLVQPELHAPRTGFTMVGLKTFGCAAHTLHCKEYLQVELKEPLVEGQAYYAEFWVSALLTGIKVSHFAVSLSDSEVDEPMEMGLFYQESVVLDKRIISSPPQEWVKVSGIFTAEYPATHLLIGNFTPDEDVQSQKGWKEHIKYAYYFIDDVLLKPVHLEAHPELEEVELKVGETFQLDDIRFAFDQSEILPVSFPQLNQLVNRLKTQPDIHVQINGHTDNIGTPEYNEELSRARAQAVVQYLSDQGISLERLSAEGFGARLPVAENTTETGRQLNRRVVLEVVKE